MSSLSDIRAKIESANREQQSLTADEVRNVEKQFSQMSLSESDIAKEQIIIKSLAFDCMPIRHEAIQEAHRQTFRWALDTQGHSAGAQCNMPQTKSLATWLRDGSDVFWVCGKPGSGKSTLMKFISQEPRTIELLSQWASPRTAVVVRHYFWSGGTTMQRSLYGLLRTLLYEIVRQCPRIIPAICPNQWSDTDSLNWTVSTLRTCFKNFINCCGKTNLNFCFFIDGLDEHDGDHLELCKLLSGLTKSANVKVCVSSRPWNVFDEAFGVRTAKLQVHELTKEDIRAYSASRLQGHPRWGLVIDNAADGQWLIDQITDRAWGVFLWAFLVTKLLLNGLTNRDRFSDICRRLNSFPRELNPFFKQILTSVELFYSSKMATTLLIALAAEKPLHFLFYEFHDQEYDDREYALKIPLQPLSEERLGDIRERINYHLDSRTRGLLELPAEGKAVTFLHRTVADFLNSEEMKQYLNTQVDPKFDFCAQLSLLRAQLAMVKAIDEPEEVNRLSFGYFQDYDETRRFTGESDIHEETFHEITQKMLAYGAIVDAENRLSWNEQLATTFDEMERVLERLVIEDDWHVHAYFREQVVTSEVFNYLERKILGDPAYVLSFGVEFAMYLVRPCCYVPETDISKDGMVAVGRNANLFRRGLRVLRRAVEAHCIVPARSEDNGSAWSHLLGLLVSPSPQRRLLLIGLLEEDIFSALLQQGFDPNAGLRSQFTGDCEVAWAVFLSCAFDIPPVERIQAAYLTTLSNFLGSGVELDSCSEASLPKSLVSRHFLLPVRESARFGTPNSMDSSFMCSVASVLAREAKGSACLVKDIQDMVKETLYSDLSDYLSVENPDLVPVSRRKRKWNYTVSSESVGRLREEGNKSRRRTRGRRSMRIP